MDKQQAFTTIFKKMMDWQHYRDVKLRGFFLDLILRCDYRPSEITGYGKRFILKPGQIITTLKELAEANGLSVQEIRTMLKKLTESKELSIESNNRYRIITLNNFSQYNYTEPATSQNTEPATSQNTEVATSQDDLQTVENKGTYKSSDLDSNKPENQEATSLYSINNNTIYINKYNFISSFNISNKDYNKSILGLDISYIYNIERAKMKNDSLTLFEGKNGRNEEIELNESGYFESLFKKAHKLYPGRKRGFAVELKNLKKKFPKKWKEAVMMMESAIMDYIEDHKNRQRFNQFCPPYKHFGTWINNECWTEEFEKFEEISRNADFRKPTWDQIQASRARFIAANFDIDKRPE